MAGPVQRPRSEQRVPPTSFPGVVPAAPVVRHGAAAAGRFGRTNVRIGDDGTILRPATVQLAMIGICVAAVATVAAYTILFEATIGAVHRKVRFGEGVAHTAAPLLGAGLTDPSSPFASLERFAERLYVAATIVFFTPCAIALALYLLTAVLAWKRISGVRILASILAGLSLVGLALPELLGALFAPAIVFGLVVVLLLWLPSSTGWFRFDPVREWGPVATSDQAAWIRVTSQDVVSAAPPPQALGPAPRTAPQPWYPAPEQSWARQPQSSQGESQPPPTVYGPVDR